MPERIPFMGGADAVSRLLVEKRCEVYSRVATLIMGLEEALDEDDALRARFLLQDVRRTLRSALAFLTDEVHAEIERLEEIQDSLPEAEGPIPARTRAELGDRLQLLHVRMARALHLPRLQDMEQIVGLAPRLKQRLEQESRELEAKGRRRALDEQCWQHESEARDLIRKKIYPKAIKSLRRAIKLDPTRAVLHNDLGVVYSLLRRPLEAVGEYRQAVSLNERHPGQRTEEWTTSYYNLGVALRKAAQEAVQRGDLGSLAPQPSQMVANAEGEVAFLGVDAARRDGQMLGSGAIPMLAEARAAFEEYTRLNATGPKVADAREIAAQITHQISGLTAGCEFSNGFADVSADASTDGST